MLLCFSNFFLDFKWTDKCRYYCISIEGIICIFFEFGFCVCAVCTKL